MRMYTVIVNIEQLESEPFLVVLVFNSEGYQVDACYRPFTSNADAIIFMSDVLAALEQTTYKVLTSNKELFATMATVPGIVVDIKHPDDTAETSRFIERNRDTLKDFYGIETEQSKPQLPRWRFRLFLLLQKLTKKVRGAETYDI
jgi:hypothetical protein